MRKVFKLTETVYRRGKVDHTFVEWYHFERRAEAAAEKINSKNKTLRAPYRVPDEYSVAVIEEVEIPEDKDWVY